MGLGPAQLRVPPLTPGQPYQKWLQRQALASPQEIAAFYAALEESKKKPVAKATKKKQPQEKRLWV